MESLTVNLKELIEHCEEWKQEYNFVVVNIDEKENTLEIHGSKHFGMALSNLDPIEGIDIENNPSYINE